MTTSSRVRAIPASGIREVMQLAAGLDCVHLEVGDPDFDTPEHVIQAAIVAAGSGMTHYSPNAGIRSLREALVTKLHDTNHLTVKLEQVVVTPGSTQALFVCILSLVDPGDEVLVPDPGWPNYEQMVRSASATPIRYRLDATDGFQPDLDSIERAISPRTRVIIVNSPSNPTGAVFSSASLQGIARIAARHGLYVISDECYEQLVFETEHESIASYADMDRTVVIHSFSKTYAMAGWRVGYAVAPTEVAAAMVKLQEPIVSCGSTVSQVAAEAAITGPQDAVAVMRDRYQARRDVAVAMLERGGLLVTKPAGTFYVLARIGTDDVDTYRYAKDLLTTARVATAPGETFGDVSRGMLRLSLVVPDDDLRTGLDRLIGFASNAGPVTQEAAN